MYTLRIIEDTRKDKDDSFEQVVENFELGKSYAILKKGMTKEFDETMKDKHPEKGHDHIKALLCAENELLFFIYEETPNRNYTYFIMTESGQTFERL